MSYEMEQKLQEQDDRAYERKLMSTPEYWSILTDEKTAVTINSDGKDSHTVSGEIKS